MSIHFCDGCIHLRPTEAQQDLIYSLTGNRPPHICHLYNRQLFHCGAHPHIVRLEDCFGFQPADDAASGDGQALRIDTGGNAILASLLREYVQGAREIDALHEVADDAQKRADKVEAWLEDRRKELAALPVPERSLYLVDGALVEVSRIGDRVFIVLHNYTDLGGR